MNFNFITEQLALQHQQNQYRERIVVENTCGKEISVDGQQYLNFSSNDYLGLNNHPDIQKALIEGVEKYGISSSASSLVTGFNYAHKALEEDIATWLNRERVLLFSSGFSANFAMMQALGKKEGICLLDKWSHASIIDGVLASEANVKRFFHNDYDQLKKLSERYKNQNQLIATEAVFSMDGDESNTQAIAEIAKNTGAMTYVDEAHSIGVKGTNGHGCSVSDIDIVMATFGKAIATSGAFVACSETLYDYLVNFARHYIYSTAISPAMAWATKRSIKIIQQEQWRREKVNYLSTLLKSALDSSINLLPTTSSIHAINMNTESNALAASKALKEKGIWATAIRPPTVPTGSSRLRVTICATHNDKNIKYLAESINEVLV